MILFFPLSATLLLTEVRLAKILLSYVISRIPEVNGWPTLCSAIGIRNRSQCENEKGQRGSYQNLLKGGVICLGMK